jgi:hypothetical protein
MGLREKLKLQERRADTASVVVPQADGSVKKFPESAAMDAFLSMSERGKAHCHGEELPPVHPLIVALRTVDEEAMPRLMSEHGTILGLMEGEDQIYEGLRERPGPPVYWNEEGTVCS